jgi:hypothetical protein
MWCNIRRCGNSKIHLKLIFFLWYVHRGVILTKDNLAKRNRQGSKKCAFCSRDETIQHLFFDYRVARFLWTLVSISFGLQPPRSIRHIFRNWLLGADAKTKNFILIWVSALCWALWLCRNNIVFEKSPMFTYMQVLFRATHWLRFWAQMQRLDGGEDILKQACHRMEVMTMQIFAYHGWRFTNRITPS